jgi:hypothetical protein
MKLSKSQFAVQQIVARSRVSSVLQYNNIKLSKSQFAVQQIATDFKEGSVGNERIRDTDKG